MRLFSLSVLVFLAACSSEPEANPVDVGSSPDIVMTADVGSDDTGAAQDADAAPDMSPQGACTGDCATLDFTAMVGANSVTLERAVYGVTAPEQSASGEWEVHVEAHAGGVSGCPTMGSPSPDQTVIITNIPVPAAAVAFSEADGLVVSMLDFAGTVTDELPLTADGEELQWVAWQVCTDCTGDDPTGFLAFDVSAPVAGGSIGGHVYATHCASLDAR